MATTVDSIKTKVNQFINDSSTNSVTDNDRLAAISIAVQDIISELNLPQSVKKYQLNFYDGLYYYKINEDIPQAYEPVQLRKELGYNTEPFFRKDPSDLVIDIDNGYGDDSFALESRDGALYLVVNYPSARYSETSLFDCDSLTDDGTWAVDSTNSDATNLTIDSVEYKEGNGSFNFDLDVSQSANNKGTIYNSSFDSKDLSEHENISTFILDADIPDNTYISSYTLYIGEDSSNYWTGSATTDFNGASLASDWNTIAIAWSDMTKVGSPSSSAIGYIAIDINYSASQTDDTDFRIDNIRVVRPEKLDFLYQSSFVGETSTGVGLYAFSTATDVPFYSGQYDHLDNVVARRASAILFDQMGYTSRADRENNEYYKELENARTKFPNTREKESKSFKVHGLNFS